MITTTDDKVKIYKAHNIAAKQMDREVGAEFKIADVIQFETFRSSGEPAVSTVIFTQSGDVYSTLSPTVDRSVNDLLNVFGDDLRKVTAKIVNGNSNSGRKFLQIDAVSID